MAKKSVLYNKNQMKKALLLVVVTTVAAIGYLGWFYWHNLRGALPAVNSPAETPEKTIGRLTIDPGFAISVFAENLSNPHGLAFYCRGEKCSLYIAETDGVSVYNYDKENLEAENRRKIIDLPAGGNHFTRTLLIAPF